MNKKREAKIKRKTNETDILVDINLDGSGKANVKSPIGFLNHMLSLFAKHGIFDLRIAAKGDTEVDIHHTNEDIGICLGLCVKTALGKKLAIRRFGFSSIPMDDSLVEVSLDLSGRPYLKLTPGGRLLGAAKQEYDLSHLKQFLQAFATSAGVTLHVEVVYGEDLHHIIEATFKALGKALREASTHEARLKGIPSTKGLL